jgi:tellurite methyltransferase
MTDKRTNDYDDAYGDDAYYFGSEPAPLLTRYAREIKPGGRVLDLGVGQGRNALPLAAAGMLVTGIDPSATAIAHTRRLATEAGLDIELWQGGILGYEPSAPFDTVLCFGLLQILSRAEIAGLLYRLERWTVPGSIILVVAWHVDDPSRGGYRDAWLSAGRHSFRSPDGEYRTYLARREIRDLLCGWEILSHDETMGPAHRHGDGPEHRHGDVELAARRR